MYKKEIFVTYYQKPHWISHSQLSDQLGYGYTPEQSLVDLVKGINNMLELQKKDKDIIVFESHVPNKETIKALEDTEKGIDLHEVKNVEELFKELELDDTPEGIVKKAKNIVEKYNIIINLEDGEYYGNSVEMPTVFSDGKTEEECIKKTKEALIIAVSYLLEQGQYLDNTEEGDRILGEAAKKIREECDLITEEEFYKETEMKKGE